jgi:G3E family GTPase
MTSALKTPLTLITGYLGSGKTTLLRRILSESELKLAIIMNEFGELGIDGKLLRTKNVDMVELTGGCVCCSLTGEFQAAVGEIIAKVHPEGIIVEATGLAEPEALLENVAESLPQIRQDATVTLVDSYGMIKYPSLGHTGRVQIEMGDIILLNKTDLVGEDDLQRIRVRVKELNPRAAIIETVRCNVPVDLILGKPSSDKTSRKVEPHPIEFSSFAYTSRERIDQASLERVLANLPPSIYRVKGFARCGEGIFVNYVAGRWDVEPFSASKTELVFIGHEAERYGQETVRELKKCELE